MSRFKQLLIVSLLILSVPLFTSVINRTPTKAELEEINGLISVGNELLERAEDAEERAETAEERGDKEEAKRLRKKAREDLNNAIKKYNEAIKKVLEYFDMDTKNVSSAPCYAPGNHRGTCGKDRDIHISEAAFRCASILASTLKHEITHANQFENNRYKRPGENDNQARMRREVEAYDAEIDCAEVTGIPESFLDELAAQKKSMRSSIKQRWRVKNLPPHIQAKKIRKRQ